MQALTVMGVGWVAKATFNMRDDVRDMKKAVGMDGNGLIAKAADNTRRLDLIDDRHLKEDTVTEIEIELSQGRRRRFRDQALPPERDR